MSDAGTKTAIAGSNTHAFTYGLFIAIFLIFIGIRLWSVVKKKRKEAEKLRYFGENILTVHMVSETAYVTKGQGVHTAFLEMTELLKEDKKIHVVINDEGQGDIFHSHTYGPYYFWKGRNYKGRRILTAHVIPDSSKGTIPFWKQLLPLTSRYLKLAYSFADVVIAISPAVEQAIKDLDVKSDIVRIYNPVLTDNWLRTPANRKKGREQLGINGDEFLIMGVGQLQGRKGVEDFIDIAEQIPGSKFVWVGGRPWGVFTEGIQRINNRINNAPPNVFFAGLFDIKDMPAMYAAADIFLFPSYQENCPLAPMEAAASGLPVVFRDIPEYRDLYISPYLKAADTAAFIKITLSLIEEKAFYESAVLMSANLVAEFDKDKIREELIALYRKSLRCYFED